MINTEDWKELQADVVDDLQLDPRNVRLETPVNAPEVDIIHDLITNEKVYSLVDGIAKIGYLTHELPVVVKRGKKLIVVEGNRRVAALKVIQNPQLAPDAARIMNLIKTLPNRNALQQIRVKLAPNQDQADQLIAALHTSNQRVPWSPTRQAAFFQAQVDAGRTLAQLTTQYPLSNVRRFVIASKHLQYV